MAYDLTHDDDLGRQGSVYNILHRTDMEAFMKPDKHGRIPYVVSQLGQRFRRDILPDRQRIFQRIQASNASDGVHPDNFGWFGSMVQWLLKVEMIHLGPITRHDDGAIVMGVDLVADVWKLQDWLHTTAMRKEHPFAGSDDFTTDSREQIVVAPPRRKTPIDWKFGEIYAVVHRHPTDARVPFRFSVYIPEYPDYSHILSHGDDHKKEGQASTHDVEWQTDLETFVRPDAQGRVPYVVTQLGHRHKRRNLSSDQNSVVSIFEELNKADEMTPEVFQALDSSRWFWYMMSRLRMRNIIDFKNWDQRGLYWTTMAFMDWLKAEATKKAHAFSGNGDFLDSKDQIKAPREKCGECTIL